MPARCACAGIGRERRVALLLLDTVDFPVAFWGALRAGVVPVPINTLLTHEMVGYILADSRAEAVVISAPLLAPLLPVLHSLPELRRIIVAQPDGGAPAARSDDPARRRLRRFPRRSAIPRPPTAPASPDEVAFWLYSSGSTGAPKGVRHVHASLRHTADTYGAQVLRIRRDDLMFSAAKAFHAYGLGNSLTFPMSVGAAAVLLPDRPTPDAVLEVLQRHNPTIFGGVPTLYASLLAHPRIGPKAGSERLRRCISAGEALPEAVGQRWFDMVGVHILDGIGSTEMLHIFVSNRPDDVRYGTSGKPVPGYEARIVDEHDRQVPHGEAGELVVRGPSAAEGYWNQREKTRRTFRGEWTYTGDTYTRDAEGYYRYCRPQRRDAEGQRRLGVAVRGGGGAGVASRGAGSRGGRRDGPRRPDQAEGVRHFAGGGEAAGRRYGEGTVEDACEGADRRVEIPALDRVRGRPAEDRDRQDPALPPAGRSPLVPRARRRAAEWIAAPRQRWVRAPHAARLPRA